MFGRKKKPSEYFEGQARLEGGLQKIEGTQHLKDRLEFTADEIDVMITELNQDLRILLRKPGKDLTDDEKTLIEEFRLELRNWHMLKMVVHASTPWLRAGDSSDMSERYSKFCMFFSRNFKKDNVQGLIMAASLYLQGISHIDKDVEAPPQIWVQNQPGPRFGGMDALAEGTRPTEKVSRNKD